VMAITVERVAGEDGNAIFDGPEWRLFVQANASRARGVQQEQSVNSHGPGPHFSGLRVSRQLDRPLPNFPETGTVGPRRPPARLGVDQFSSRAFPYAMILE
jgi:hypothetical protein